MNLLWASFFALAATAAQAQTLEFPGNASLQSETTSPLDSYLLPLGIWDRGALPTKVVEGQITQQAWRIDAVGLTTLQILRPLREQLRNDGYRVIFDCQTEACGGFDFRFAVETLSPPAMQINIGDFRFLSAEKTRAAGSDYMTLFVSRTAQAGFVQITHISHITTAPEQSAPLAAASAPSSSTGPADLGAQLDTVGHAVLDDLAFDTGSAQLATGQFVSLQALADYLARFPNRTVALVGHTDSEGSLAGNVALSKRRAGSVLERLVADYGVRRGQIAAEGMGYLSPIASNRTEDGREANRRVEVIITSTQD